METKIFGSAKSAGICCYSIVFYVLYMGYLYLCLSFFKVWECYSWKIFKFLFRDCIWSMKVLFIIELEHLFFFFFSFEDFMFWQLHLKFDHKINLLLNFKLCCFIFKVQLMFHALIYLLVNCIKFLCLLSPNVKF